jgi:ubiquinone/menaquinone biosynthesis C-methylase UbiE
MPRPVPWAEYERAMWAQGLEYYRFRLRGLSLSGRQLLDLGCGPGQWAAAAAAEGFEVTACDRKIAGAALEAAVRLVSVEATQLPFRDHSYDSVLCNLVLPYLPVEDCVLEVRRVLRVGGTFFGICHGAGYYLMQAARGLRQGPKATMRRLGIVGYTLAHQALGFRRYHCETFQSPRRFARMLHQAGFEVVGLRLGGHPVIPEIRFLRIPVFFEFVARRAR